MKGRKKTGQNILHYVIASNVVIVFIIAILGGYLFRFYYKKMQEDFYKENSVYIGNIAKTHGKEQQKKQEKRCGQLPLIPGCILPVTEKTQRQWQRSWEAYT